MKAMIWLSEGLPEISDRERWEKGEDGVIRRYNL